MLQWQGGGLLVQLAATADCRVDRQASQTGEILTMHSLAQPLEMFWRWKIVEGDPEILAAEPVHRGCTQRGAGGRQADPASHDSTAAE